MTSLMHNQTPKPSLGFADQAFPHFFMGIFIFCIFTIFHGFLCFPKIKVATPNPYFSIIFAFEIAFSSRDSANLVATAWRLHWGYVESQAMITFVFLN